MYKKQEIATKHWKNKKKAGKQLLMELHVWLVTAL